MWGYNGNRCCNSARQTKCRTATPCNIDRTTCRDFCINQRAASCIPTCEDNERSCSYYNTRRSCSTPVRRDISSVPYCTRPKSVEPLVSRVPFRSFTRQCQPKPVNKKPKRSKSPSKKVESISHSLSDARLAINDNCICEKCPNDEDEDTANVDPTEHESSNCCSTNKICTPSPDLEETRDEEYQEICCKPVYHHQAEKSFDNHPAEAPRLEKKSSLLSQNSFTSRPIMPTSEPLRHRSSDTSNNSNSSRRSILKAASVCDNICKNKKKVTLCTPVCEEHEYLHFLLRITEDILRNDLYSNEEMERVFESHIKANIGCLDEKKMRQQVENLRNELRMPFQSKPVIDAPCSCSVCKVMNYNIVGNNANKDETSTHLQHTEKETSKNELVQSHFSTQIIPPHENSNPEETTEKDITEVEQIKSAVPSIKNDDNIDEVENIITVDISIESDELGPPIEVIVANKSGLALDSQTNRKHPFVLSLEDIIEERKSFEHIIQSHGHKVIEKVAATKTTEIHIHKEIIEEDVNSQETGKMMAIKDQELEAEAMIEEENAGFRDDDKSLDAYLESVEAQIKSANISSHSLDKLEGTKSFDLEAATNEIRELMSSPPLQTGHSEHYIDCDDASKKKNKSYSSIKKSASNAPKSKEILQDKEKIKSGGRSLHEIQSAPARSDHLSQVSTDEEEDEIIRVIRNKSGSVKEYRLSLIKNESKKDHLGDDEISKSRSSHKQLADANILSKHELEISRTSQQSCNECICDTDNNVNCTCQSFKKFRQEQQMICNINDEFCTCHRDDTNKELVDKNTGNDQIQEVDNLRSPKNEINASLSSLREQWRKSQNSIQEAKTSQAMDEGSRLASRISVKNEQNHSRTNGLDDSGLGKDGTKTPVSRSSSVDGAKRNSGNSLNKSRSNTKDVKTVSKSNKSIGKLSRSNSMDEGPTSKTSSMHQAISSKHSNNIVSQNNASKHSHIAASSRNNSFHEGKTSRSSSIDKTDKVMSRENSIGKFSSNSHHTVHSNFEHDYPDVLISKNASSKLVSNIEYDDKSKSVSQSNISSSRNEIENNNDMKAPSGNIHIIKSNTSKIRDSSEKLKDVSNQSKTSNTLSGVAKVVSESDQKKSQIIISNNDLSEGNKKVPCICQTGIKIHLEEAMNDDYVLVDSPVCMPRALIEDKGVPITIQDMSMLEEYNLCRCTFERNCTSLHHGVVTDKENHCCSTKVKSEHNHKTLDTSSKLNSNASISSIRSNHNNKEAPEPRGIIHTPDFPIDHSVHENLHVVFDKMKSCSRSDGSSQKTVQTCLIKNELNSPLQFLEKSDPSKINNNLKEKTGFIPTRNPINRFKKRPQRLEKKVFNSRSPSPDAILIKNYSAPVNPKTDRLFKFEDVKQKSASMDGSLKENHKYKGTDIYSYERHMDASDKVTQEKENFHKKRTDLELMDYYINPEASSFQTEKVLKIYSENVFGAQSFMVAPLTTDDESNKTSSPKKKFCGGKNCPALTNAKALSPSTQGKLIVDQSTVPDRGSKVSQNENVASHSRSPSKSKTSPSRQSSKRSSDASAKSVSNEGSKINQTRRSSDKKKSMQGGSITAEAALPPTMATLAATSSLGLIDIDPEKGYHLLLTDASTNVYSREIVAAQTENKLKPSVPNNVKISVTAEMMKEISVENEIDLHAGSNKSEASVEILSNEENEEDNIKRDISNVIESGGSNEIEPVLVKVPSNSIEEAEEEQEGSTSSKNSQEKADDSIGSQESQRKKSEGEESRRESEQIPSIARISFAERVSYSRAPPTPDNKDSLSIADEDFLETGTKSETVAILNYEANRKPSEAPSDINSLKRALFAYSTPTIVSGQPETERESIMFDEFPEVSTRAGSITSTVPVEEATAQHVKDQLTDFRKVSEDPLRKFQFNDAQETAGTSDAAKQQNNATKKSVPKVGSKHSNDSDAQRICCGLIKPKSK